ncbi:MAG: type II toxin-antitoxin system VapC family toxin [Bryobacteraceae bacterium]
MSGVLVDSDVLIEVLRQRKPEVDRRWMDLMNTGQLVFYSPVSLAEIRHGMRERERELIERAFSRMRCVPIAIEIATRAGDYLRAFHASHALALGDALIAATASVHDLELWTQNRKHFLMKDVQFFN